MLEEIWIMGQQLFVSVRSFLTELIDLVVKLWKNIIKSTKTSFLALAQKLAPSLSSLIEEAYVLFDKVAAPVRVAAKKAWNELRKYLLKQTVDIFQLENGQWIYRTISWLLLPKEKKVRHIVQDTPVFLHELSDDVLEQLKRNGRIKELDITKTIDGQFGITQNTAVPLDELPADVLKRLIDSGRIGELDLTV